MLRERQAHQSTGASVKKKNYKDNFEELYLRHDYIKKAGKLNGKYCKEYKHIIDITSRIMFKKFYRDFSRVGFVLEDIKTISSVYVMAYMELYSIENNEEQRTRFEKKFKRLNSYFPNPADFQKEETNHMVNFLRQKLRHCATVCKRKSRNIICGSDRSKVFAYTDQSIEADPEEILSDYSKYGYRRVTKDEYNEARNRAKNLGEKQLVDGEGFKVIKIESLTKGISSKEYRDIVESTKSEKFLDPESRMIIEEERNNLQNYKDIFENMNSNEKSELLCEFIDKNKNNKFYKNQVKLARKILKESVL